MKSHSPETYRMFGKINATSRLMYTYMPQMVQKPTRSDEAEADWHYTQFLNLSAPAAGRLTPIWKSVFCIIKI